MRPRLLRPDNFTPPSRTPWGGRAIVERIKRGLDLHLGLGRDLGRDLGLGLDRDLDLGLGLGRGRDLGLGRDRGLGLGAAATLGPVGESWEISTEPSFPSRFADDDSELAAAIRDAPVAWLGARVAARHHGQNPLLVKLLDTADALSVQVHPRADDPALAADESGKPESWYVLAAAPGAGLYLGFRDHVDRADVERCLENHGRFDELMNFVTVAPGDGFLIPAGTVHAIGAGLTLLEPQFVSPGKRGVTYRFWDWNRRYDEEGRVTTQGSPRPLHIERSLQVTRWQAPRGLEAVNECRARAEILRAPAAGALGRTRVLSWPYFQVERWAGRGTLELAPPGQSSTGPDALPEALSEALPDALPDALLAIVCVAGAARLETGTGTLDIRRGQSAVVPAAALVDGLRVDTSASPDGVTDADDPEHVELLITHS